MKYIIFACCSLVISCSALVRNVSLQPHEKWWQTHVAEKLNHFADWLGDVDAISRKTVRAYVHEKKYTSVLDAACGLCTEFFGYKKDAIAIDYKGIDITPFLVDRARSLGIDVKHASIENIPYPDASFDVCYGRHILEHLEYYHKALNELIRVADKEVIIIFFLKPLDSLPDKICVEPVDGILLHHNWYNKQRLEQFVMANAKVKYMQWQHVDAQEVILHIYI
jgi:ubiquinone/menaquinone biosynthesis C-methylase UbiE